MACAEEGVGPPGRERGFAEVAGPGSGCPLPVDPLPFVFPALALIPGANFAHDARCPGVGNLDMSTPISAMITAAAVGHHPSPVGTGAASRRSRPRAQRRNRAALYRLVVWCMNRSAEQSLTTRPLASSLGYVASRVRAR
jgi:hypothetical protein